MGNHPPWALCTCASCSLRRYCSCKWSKKVFVAASRWIHVLVLRTNFCGEYVSFVSKKLLVVYSRLVINSKKDIYNLTSLSLIYILFPLNIEVAIIVILNKNGKRRVSLNNLKDVASSAASFCKSFPNSLSSSVDIYNVKKLFFQIKNSKKE